MNFYNGTYVPLYSTQTKYIFTNTMEDDNVIALPSSFKEDSGDDYVACKIFVGKANAETDKNESNSESPTYKCHVCDIDVPRPFIKNHKSSSEHARCLEIMTIALERAQKIAASNEVIHSKKVSNCFYCESCNQCLNSKDKYAHQLTKRHNIATLFDRLFNDVLKIYKNKEYMQKVDFSYLKDLKVTPNSATKKNTSKQLDQNINGDSKKISRHSVKCSDEGNSFHLLSRDCACFGDQSEDIAEDTDLTPDEGSEFEDSIQSFDYSTEALHNGEKEETYEKQIMEKTPKKSAKTISTQYDEKDFNVIVAPVPVADVNHHKSKSSHAHSSRKKSRKAAKPIKFRRTPYSALKGSSEYVSKKHQLSIQRLNEDNMKMTLDNSVKEEAANKTENTKKDSGQADSVVTKTETTINDSGKKDADASKTKNDSVKANAEVYNTKKSKKESGKASDVSKIETAIEKSGKSEAVASKTKKSKRESRKANAAATKTEMTEDSGKSDIVASKNSTTEKESETANAVSSKTETTIEDSGKIEADAVISKIETNIEESDPSTLVSNTVSNTETTVADAIVSKMDTNMKHSGKEENESQIETAKEEYVEGDSIKSSSIRSTPKSRCSSRRTCTVASRIAASSKTFHEMQLKESDTRVPVAPSAIWPANANSYGVFGPTIALNEQDFNSTKINEVNENCFDLISKAVGYPLTSKSEIHTDNATLHQNSAAEISPIESASSNMYYTAANNSGIIPNFPFYEPAGGLYSSSIPLPHHLVPNLNYFTIPDAKDFNNSLSTFVQPTSANELIHSVAPHEPETRPAVVSSTNNFIAPIVFPSSYGVNIPGILNQFSIPPNSTSLGVPNSYFMQLITDAHNMKAADESSPLKTHFPIYTNDGASSTANAANTTVSFVTSACDESNPQISRHSSTLKDQCDPNLPKNHDESNVMEASSDSSRNAAVSPKRLCLVCNYSSRSTPQERHFHEASMLHRIHFAKLYTSLHYHFKIYGDRIVCIVCNVNVELAAVNTHVFDINHIMKYNTLLTKNAIEKSGANYFCYICSEIIEGDKELEHIMFEKHTRPLTVTDETKKFYCKLCNVHVPKNPVNVISHVTGQQHRRKVKRIFR